MESGKTGDEVSKRCATGGTFQMARMLSQVARQVRPSAVPEGMARKVAGVCAAGAHSVAANETLLPEKRSGSGAAARSFT